MKKTVKILLFAVVFVCLFSLTALAVNFPDVPRDGSERANAIYKLADNGIVGGYEDGNFRPNNYLTRAELCKIVNLIFGYTEKASENFKDIKKTDWYYDYVLIARKAGYIGGFEDQTFRGQSNLTREQTCKIICCTAGLYDLPTVTVVKDKISDWAKKDVMKVIANFVMSPDSNGNFRATQNITRAELAMALDAFVKVKPVEPSTPSTPSIPSVPSTPSVTKYTVKFYDGDEKTVVNQQSVEKGGSASVPNVTPTKADDNEYTYKFIGWDRGFGNVTSNLNIYPLFSKTPKTYKVTLDYGTGTTGITVKEIEVTYNELLADKLPKDGFKNGTKYFAGWYAGSELIDSEKYSDLTPLTLKAVWVNTFVVKFYDGDGTVIGSQTVNYGKNATAPTKTPTKEQDNYYSYKFSGKWDKEFTNVTSNLDVYPVFNKTERTYKVTLNYGTGVTGNKPSSVTMTYDQLFSEVLPTSGFENGAKLFGGWYSGSELVDTEKYSDLTPTSLTAKWTDKTFTVKFYDSKGNVIGIPQSVKYGENATPPANPTKASENEYTYEFSGWDKSYENVTSNLDIKPLFNRLDRYYKVTLNYGNGTTEEIEMTYNQPFSSVLSSTGFENGNKIFAGWYVGSVLVDNEKYSDLKPTTVTAKWTDKTFTVKFYDAKGNIIGKAQTVVYGESATPPANPAKAADNEYTYTFSGWSVDYKNVKTDLNVYPEYTRSTRTYKVTLNYGNGTTEEIEMTYYQAFSTVLPTTGFENGKKIFAGWYVGSVLVDDERYCDLKATTVTAKWQDNTYTVKFYDGDRKTVLATRNVKEGGTATVPTKTPTKAADKEYTYDFSGWDKSYKNVTQNLDIYPEFTKNTRYYTVYLDYGEGTEDISTESIPVTYSQSLMDKLPTEGFKCYDLLFVGWYDSDELIDDECYYDLKSDTLTARWKKDPQVAEDNKVVRDELKAVLGEIDEPLAYGFTEEQLWVLEPVIEAITKTLADSADDKIRIVKQYILDNYSDCVALASHRMRHPYEYEHDEDDLSEKEKEDYTEKFKDDFMWDLANNLSAYTVDYLLDFFDIDKNDYIN